jgi:hypothetical protein
MMVLIILEFGKSDRKHGIEKLQVRSFNLKWSGSYVKNISLQGPILWVKDKMFHVAKGFCPCFVELDNALAVLMEVGRKGLSTAGLDWFLGEAGQFVVDRGCGEK